MYKILIIEDDLTMAQAIQKEMTAWGNEAEYVQDFRNVMKTFAEYDPHLVLMDITLPFYNGYHWCSEIRKVSDVPVIFISSASDNMNIIMAVNMGGDDFIAKPFDLGVLTAKIQAVLRRTYDMSGKVPVLEHRGAMLNLYDTCLTYEGKKISLTKNEFRILQTLMENKGRLVSRETLSSTSEPEDADDRSIHDKLHCRHICSSKFERFLRLGLKISVNFIKFPDFIFAPDIRFHHPDRRQILLDDTVHHIDRLLHLPIERTYICNDQPQTCR